MNQHVCQMEPEWIVAPQFSLDPVVQEGQRAIQLCFRYAADRRKIPDPLMKIFCNWLWKQIGIVYEEGAVVAYKPIFQESRKGRDDY